MTVEPTSLPLSCRHCHRPVKLTYVADLSAIARRYIWICPYAECRQMDVIDLYGESPTVVTDVFRQDEPSSTT